MPTISISPAIGSSQNESAFSFGNAMSAAPIISGITKFPSPANAGMMNRKIINAAWFVISTLKVCGLKYCVPGFASSARKSIAKKPPIEEEDERRDRRTGSRSPCGRC